MQCEPVGTTHFWAHLTAAVTNRAHSSTDGELGPAVAAAEAADPAAPCCLSGGGNALTIDSRFSTAVTPGGTPPAAYACTAGVQGAVWHRYSVEYVGDYSSCCKLSAGPAGWGGLLRLSLFSQLKWPAAPMPPPLLPR